MTTLFTFINLAYTTSFASGNNSPCPNQIAGSWTLTTANLTINGTTTFPYGSNPQGILTNTPAPDYTFVEELGARNYTPGNSYSMSQANAGTYQIDENGAFLGRTTLSSTIASNVGTGETTAVFNLTRDGNTLVEVYKPVPGTVVAVVWTKFIPGSTSF